MDREFRTLVATVERERKGTLVISFILLVLFAMVALEAARFSLSHIPSFIQGAVPDDAVPELLRTTLVTEIFLIAAPMLLFTACMFVIFFLSVGMVSRNHYKLVLRMAKELANEGDEEIEALASADDS